MKSVRHAIRKITSAVVRAEGHEEFSAMTKSTVSASRLRVIRFAQFMCALLLAKASPPRHSLGEGGAVSKSALFSLTHPQSIGRLESLRCDAYLPLAEKAMLPQRQ